MMPITNPPSGPGDQPRSDPERDPATGEPGHPQRQEGKEPARETTSPNQPQGQPAQTRQPGQTTSASPQHPRQPTDHQGEPKPKARSLRGFAAMDAERQRAIASKGGQSQGKANNPGNFANDRQKAREAGRKGGQA